MIDLIRRPLRIPPVVLAFAGSLLLHLVAISGTVIVNRDAALYLHIARQVVELGPGAAQAHFDWPWFSLLIAGTHVLLGLPFETAAYLWCVLFMGGTCALLVAICQRYVAGSGYWACLVVLSIPACNQLRDDILREFGFWFFCVLALWLALQWFERRGWWRAVLIQLAIGLAALFRLEAVFLLPVFIFCLLPELNTFRGWLGLVQLNALPLAALPVLALSGLAGEARVTYYWSLLGPQAVLQRFDLIARGFAEVALQKHAVDDARRVVFFGLLFSLLAKFFAISGPFALPFAYHASWSAVGEYWRKLRPLAVAWLLYFGILFLFLVQQGFVNGRYAAFLNLLAIPLLTMALLAAVNRFPRFAKPFVVLAAVVMLANVVSLGAKKTHYLEASAWLSRNTQPSDFIFYDDSRIAYYAGRGYPMMPTREDLIAAQAEYLQKIRYFVIAERKDEPKLENWLAEQGKRVLVRFANRKGETVLIIGD